MLKPDSQKLKSHKILLDVLDDMVHLGALDIIIE